MTFKAGKWRAGIFGPVTLILASVLSIFVSCNDFGNVAPSSAPISTDEALFRKFTVEDPFSSYALFPRVDSLTSGSLNGSTAHQPLVRVSMNAKAYAALHNGVLPHGASFPEGSVVFKQVILSGQTTIYAVIFKDSSNPLSSNGWLWAEYRPDGTTAFSVANKGNGCIACHSLEQGPQHDHVRTFERQR